MVQNLPPDSATVRAEMGNDWGSAEYLFRQFLDEFRMYRREYAMAHGAKEGDLGDFKPTPIPGEKPDTEKPDVESAQVYQLFQKMRERGQAV
jgi:hypothetical protein